MYMLFVDESGNPAPPDKHNEDYFVLGGLIIHEDDWHQINRDFIEVKNDYGITGEIKWRYFNPTDNRSENSLAHLPPAERFDVREEFYEILKSFEAVTIISVIGHIPTAYTNRHTDNDVKLYHAAYKALSERFQYFLQDESKASGFKVNGIIICDQQRTGVDDERLRQLHQTLTTEFSYTSAHYANVVECLLLAPSHYSVGIQLADLVAGAIYRKCNAADDRFFAQIKPLIRKSNAGKIEGYGMVRLPRHSGSWHV